MKTKKKRTVRSAEFVIDESNRKSKEEKDKHTNRKTWIITLFNQVLSQVIANILIHFLGL